MPDSRPVPPSAVPAPSPAEPPLAPPVAPPLDTWIGLLRAALREDVGPCDWTSRVAVAADSRSRARIEARQSLVVCGLAVAERVFHEVAPELRVERCSDDGTVAGPGAALLRIEGPTRPLLTAERTALNFLQRLCGVATHTADLVARVRGTPARIVDTRKTLPGWRALDKYAVATGGGTNHRMGLYDGILLKDNHIAAAGGVKAAVRAALAAAPGHLRVQVEVESDAQAVEAVEAGADFLLLDNLPPEAVRAVVERLGGQAVLEASGGITRENLRAYAETGVHRISLGALTHSAPAADVALELDP